MFVKYREREKEEFLDFSFLLQKIKYVLFYNLIKLY